MSRTGGPARVHCREVTGRGRDETGRPRNLKGMGLSEIARRTRKASSNPYCIPVPAGSEALARRVAAQPASYDGRLRVSQFANICTEKRGDWFQVTRAGELHDYDNHFSSFDILLSIFWFFLANGSGHNSNQEKPGRPKKAATCTTNGNPQEVSTCMYAMQGTQDQVQRPATLRALPVAIDRLRGQTRYTTESGNIA